MRLLKPVGGHLDCLHGRTNDSFEIFAYSSHSRAPAAPSGSTMTNRVPVTGEKDFFDQ